MNFLLLLDILVVGVIIAQALGRWGNFFNGEAYGRIVSLSFLKGMHLPKFIIETFRSDSLLIGSIKIAQIVSIISCIVGIYLLFKNIKSNKLYKEEKIFIEK